MKKYFYQQVSALLLAMMCGFACALAVFIGFQWLLIWSGSLINTNVGIALDTLGGVLTIAPIFIGALVSDDMSDFTMIMFITMLSIIGIYVSVVFFFNWFFYIGAMALFIGCLIKLDRYCTKKFWLYAMLGCYLCYSVGAYYALKLNGLEPVMDMTAINVLTALLVCVWSKPFISYMGECWRLSF